MKHTISLIAAAVTLAAAGAAHALTFQQATNIASQNGYYARGLELTAGVWHADAISVKDGKRVAVLVDNASGKLDVVDPAKVRNGQLPSAAQVTQVLKNAGWAIIQELELDDGLWEAEVRRAKGQPKVEVYVHPITLAILNDGGAPASGGTGMSALTAQQIIAALQNAGYTNIHDVEFDDDGYWEADAINRNGQCVELRVNPTTGAVLREKVEGYCAGTVKPTQPTTPTQPVKPTQPAAGKLTAAQITQRLQMAGYTNIHDLEYDRDDGYWEADARNPRGQKVELHIDPNTGKIIREKRD